VKKAKVTYHFDIIANVERIYMNKVISDLLALRVIVGYLGEAHMYAWWDSNFLSETGLSYLSYNFPRTTLVAGVNGATKAAKMVHDKRIGRAQVRHLFRLGNAVDKLLHEALMQQSQDELRAKIGSKEQAMKSLKALATRTVDAPEGSVQIGKTKDITTSDAVIELAAHYLSGFEQEQMVLPFFGVQQR